MVETLILDLGGVLMDHDRSRLAPYWDRMPKEAMEQYGLGKISTDAFLKEVHLRVPEVSTADWIPLWNSLHGGIPDSRLDQLERWHRQMPCFILSNNNDLHWQDVEKRWPRLLTLVDGLILSHREHLHKPDRAIYEVADRVIGDWHCKHGREYRPERALFVDDIPVNTEAARKHGWQVCNRWEDINL